MRYAIATKNITKRMLKSMYCNPEIKPMKKGTVFEVNRIDRVIETFVFSQSYLRSSWAKEITEAEFCKKVDEANL